MNAKTLFPGMDALQKSSGNLTVQPGCYEKNPILIVSYQPVGYWSEAITTRLRYRKDHKGVNLEIEFSHSSGGRNSQPDDLTAASNFIACYQHAVKLSILFKAHFAEAKADDTDLLELFQRADAQLTELHAQKEHTDGI